MWNLPVILQPQIILNVILGVFSNFSLNTQNTDTNYKRHREKEEEDSKFLKLDFLFALWKKCSTMLIIFTWSFRKQSNKVILSWFLDNSWFSGNFEPHNFYKPDSFKKYWVYSYNSLFYLLTHRTGCMAYLKKIWVAQYVETLWLMYHKFTVQCTVQVITECYIYLPV